MIAGFSKWSWAWRRLHINCSREADKAAHSLARDGSLQGVQEFWFDVPSPFLNTELVSGRVISTNNIVTGMVRGSQVRFQSTKITLCLNIKLPTNTTGKSEKTVGQKKYVQTSLAS
jgi:hypothetical protein